jgi:hypothetical protein
MIGFDHGRLSRRRFLAGFSLVAVAPLVAACTAQARLAHHRAAQPAAATTAPAAPTTAAAK